MFTLTDDEYAARIIGCKGGTLWRPSSSEGDDLVVVVDERADARVTVVLVDLDDTGVLDRVVDAERARAELTRRGFVLDGPRRRRDSRGPRPLAPEPIGSPRRRR